MSSAMDSMTQIDRLHNQAMKQYQTALIRVKDEGASIDANCLLIVIMMLSAFESRRGEWTAASQHMNGLIQIGKSFIERGELLEDSLIQALRYTESMAANLQSVNIRAGWGARTLSRDRPVQDLRKAHDALEQMRPVVLKVSSEHRAVPGSAMRDGVEFMLDKLDNWWKSYSHCTAGDGWVCDCPISYLQYLPAYLEAWCRVLKLELISALEPETFLDDRYDEEFRMVIHPAEGFLTGISRSGGDMAAVTKCIGFETSGVLLLGLIGLRCRQPLLRRDTLRVLRWWKGVCPSSKADVYADVIETLMRIEEAACLSGKPKRSGDIPQHARLHLVRVTFLRFDEILGTSIVDNSHPTHFEIVSQQDHDQTLDIKGLQLTQLWDRKSKSVVPGGMAYPASMDEFCAEIWPVSLSSDFI